MMPELSASPGMRWSNQSLFLFLIPVSLTFDSAWNPLRELCKVKALSILNVADFALWEGELRFLCAVLPVGISRRCLVNYFKKQEVLRAAVRMLMWMGSRIFPKRRGILGRVANPLAQVTQTNSILLPSFSCPKMWFSKGC
jgi:hypothetical protein